MSRYFVPDLSPQARLLLSGVKPRILFVAESPHLHEVEPQAMQDRRPLCGKAGREWWGALSEILEGQVNWAVDLGRLIQLCRQYRIVVMNAVQCPLDPKVSARFPDADPLKTLGFHKMNGESSFKKLKSTKPVQKAILSLGRRLQHPSVKEVPIYCLGNDATWFVQKALPEEEWSVRMKEKIPHPSAWWRRGGYYGRVAREILKRAL